MANLTKLNTIKATKGNVSSGDDINSATLREAPTPTKTNDDPEGMSEDEKKRIMRMIEQEDSSDDDDENDSDNEEQDSTGQV